MRMMGRAEGGVGGSDGRDDGVVWDGADAIDKNICGDWVAVERVGGNDGQSGMRTRR